MLEQLHSINWAGLEHAYGTAEDVPAIIERLLSEDDYERRTAQEMLSIGPFHQGTVTSCLPYVVRFLIELLSNESTPDRAWIIKYLAHTANVCNKCTDVDLEAIPTQVRATMQQQVNEIDTAEEQLCMELSSKINVFDKLVDHESDAIGASALALLVKLQCPDITLLDRIAAMLQKESNTKMRAAFGFCLGMMSNDSNGKYSQSVENILLSSKEDVLVRLAAGLGLVHGFGQETSEIVLEYLAQMIKDNPDRVAALDQFHQNELTGLVKVWPHTRLLSALTLLNTQQRAMFIAAIETMQDYVNRNGRIGIGHIQGVLKRLTR